MIIALTGFMGCGKSSVGRELSTLLRIPVVDLDQYIVQKAGRSIADIFAKDGEPFFRNLETEALYELLRGSPLSEAKASSDAPRRPCETEGRERQSGGSQLYRAEGGTNFQGTVPPDWGRVMLLRPMLGMTREEIEAYAREHGVEYREDRTNAEVEYKRNRIRNAVFPEFAKVNPSFVRTLNEDMEHFAQAEAIVEDYFREAEDKVLKDNRIDVQALLGLRHWKYVVFRILEPLGFHRDTLEAVQRLLEDYASGGGTTFAGKRFLSPTHVLETSSGAIAVLPRDDAAVPEEDIIVKEPGEFALRGRTVSIELLDPPPGAMLKQPAGTLICDAAALPFPFMLRGWLPGDWMRPFGMGGKAKKISDLFTDCKYSLTEKEAAVVVYSPALDRDGDGHVAAVAGLRMDEALRVAKGSVKILRITLP